jgi:regulator of cell morphogenesis and NO signaling
MIDYAQETLRSIISRDYRASEIFRRHHLDFCSKGDLNLMKICSLLQIRHEDIIAELNELYKTEDVAQVSGNQDIMELKESIRHGHHATLTENMKQIDAYLRRLVSVHEEQFPWIRSVLRHFETLTSCVQEMIKRKELVLFPAIDQMSQCIQQKSKYTTPGFGSVRNLLNRLIGEHEQNLATMDKIRALTQGFTAPADACNTFAVAMGKLKELHILLKTNAELERDVLFTQIIELEQLLLSD